MRSHSRPIFRVVLLSCSLALPAEAAAPPAGGRHVEVIVATANVRTAASPTAPVAFRLTKGTVAKLIGTEGDWCLIEDSSGRQGYVSKVVVRLGPEPAPATVETPAPPPAREEVGLAIDHKPVGCIVAEQYPRLDACLAPENNVGRAYVHFRTVGSEPWYSVELKRDGPCYSTFLPRPKRTTREIQYYVDVIDRAMSERQQPGDAPDGAYRARVVRKERDCDVARMAAAFARAAGPILVSIARDAGGQVLSASAAALMEHSAVLAGFESQGVLMGATGAAPGAAASAGTSTTSGSAGGGAGGGGGVGIGTIAVVGGVVAAGAIALAAKGGGGGGGGTNTPPATQPSTPTAPGGQPGTGDIAFKLTWSSAADLDLYVQEPNGTVLYYGNPASPSGGRLDFDSNAGCANASANPVENVFWQTGQAPRGTYVYWVQSFCGPASSFTLQVLRGVGGAVAATQSGTVGANGQSARFSFVF